MKRTLRAAALFFSLLFLLPVQVLAEEGKQIAESSAPQEREAENSSAHVGASSDDLCRQIQDTYAAAKKRSRRRSFKGYCGAYVANQLVVLGINTSYLSANGKNTYDIYQKLDVTTGGYRITAYGAKRFSLAEALDAIVKKDPAARNILVGFQKGVSSSGKKYGHVLFIHGVKNGMVYFSDSCARTVDEVKYKEGEPIVCSLASFVDLYARYKLDGVVHFQMGDSSAQKSITEETASTSSENAAALG